MATQTEKTGTVSDLVDDMAFLLEGLSGWADADTGMVNDQSDERWYHNGRVFGNNNTGTYLAFYVAPGNGQGDDLEDHRNNRDAVDGVRILHSSGWDTDKHVPRGLTNVHGGETSIKMEVEHKRHDSFQRHYEENNKAGAGIWLFSKRNDNSRVTFSQLECSYFISAGNDYFNVAAWNNSDGNTGAASYMAWEYVDNKFYDDGTTPVSIINRTTATGRSDNNSNEGSVMYGFNDYRGDDIMDAGKVGSDSGAIKNGNWGRLNPDANDDTYFVQRPVVYRSHRQIVPVAYIEDAIPNDIKEGVAHGDTVTQNGTDYLALRQAGASKNSPVVACLRFE